MATREQLRDIKESGWGVLSEYRLNGEVIVQVIAKPDMVVGYVIEPNGTYASPVKSLRECDADFRRIVDDYNEPIWLT